MIYLSDRKIEVARFGTINLFSLMEGSTIDISRKKRLFAILGVTAESVPFGFVGVVYRVAPSLKMEREELYKGKVEGILYRNVKGDYSIVDEKTFMVREVVSNQEEWIRAELSKSKKRKARTQGGVPSKSKTTKGVKRGKK
jgi:hypothetical protein